MRAETFVWARQQIITHIADVYDDPAAAELYSADDIRAWMQRMKRIAHDLDLDFDIIVKEHTTLYERERVGKILHQQ